MKQQELTLTELKALTSHPYDKFYRTRNLKLFEVQSDGSKLQVYINSYDQEQFTWYLKDWQGKWLFEFICPEYQKGTADPVLTLMEASLDWTYSRVVAVLSKKALKVLARTDLL